MMSGETPTMEHAGPQASATATHFRLNAHEELCLERHRTLNEKIDTALAALTKIGDRQWAIVLACAGTSMLVCISLVGGILLWLANRG